MQINRFILLKNNSTKLDYPKIALIFQEKLQNKKESARTNFVIIRNTMFF